VRFLIDMSLCFRSVATYFVCSYAFPIILTELPLTDSDVFPVLIGFCF